MPKTRAKKSPTPEKSAVAQGRPLKAPSERLVAYGLHLSPEKKDKLFELKTYEGISVRDWIEGAIEEAYVRMQAEKAADRVARRETRAARSSPSTPRKASPAAQH